MNGRLNEANQLVEWNASTSLKLSISTTFKHYEIIHIFLSNYFIMQLINKMPYKKLGLGIVQVQLVTFKIITIV